MEERVKYFIENELSGSSHEALNAAVKALYFNDNSDYQTALYEVVEALLDGNAPDYINNNFISELALILNPDFGE